nr:hypothetical protein [Tanacetum cinerariifolium]
MILESVENGPFIWLTIKENGATNIILQGLPADIYSLVNRHRVAKGLWERVHLLMQDLHTNNFDQLHAYLKQHEIYANEVRLLRERNQNPLAFVSNQQMTPHHFNTYQCSYNNPQLQQQFPPSQNGSIHPTQHYPSTYQSQPQFNHSSVPPSYPYQSQMNHQTSYITLIAYQSPQASTQPMTELPLVDLGFDVLVFSPEDDPIACLNKAMAFLTAVASSRSILTDLKEYIKMDVERQSVKVKELQERCIIKAFKLSYQEKYEYVGPEVIRLQDGKRSQDDNKKLCLIDDLKEVLNHIHIK